MLASSKGILTFTSFSSFPSLSFLFNSIISSFEFFFNLCFLIPGLTFSTVLDDDLDVLLDPRELDELLLEL